MKRRSEAYLCALSDLADEAGNVRSLYRSNGLPADGVSEQDLDESHAALKEALEAFRKAERRGWVG